MALIDDLLTAVGNALPGCNTPGLTTLSDAWDVYEVFVWTIVLRAASQQGPVTITYHDHNGQPTVTLVFPTSPVSVGRSTYSHARIAFPQKRLLEAHVGVYAAGRSTVHHECDVMVVSHAEATTCRQYATNNANSTIHPRSTEVVCFGECKCYDKTALSIGIGRSFLGVTLDLRPARGAFASNKDYDRLERLLVRNQRRYVGSLVPTNIAEVNVLRLYFEQAFAAFKAKP
jgi:hypothetical protein